MAATYEAIATVEVGSGGAANIEFTSIPGTYTDLAIMCSARNTGAEPQMNIEFNGSTSGYSYRRLNADGSIADSASGSGLSKVPIGRMNDSTQTANTFASNFIYIPNYASSNNKSISSEGANENNATAARMTMWAALWANSAAITSIKLIPEAFNFAQYSTATLYGIKNS